MKNQGLLRTYWEVVIDRGFTGLTRWVAFGILALLLWMIWEVVTQSWPAMQVFGIKFLISSAWNVPRQIYGILPAIYGTVISSFLALLIALPIGLGSAVVLSENFLPKFLRRSLVFAVELLAAIPSVIYGLWGIYFLIPQLKPLGHWFYQHLRWIPFFSSDYVGPGMLPAGIVLAIMILPILTVIARDSLASLPEELRWASYGVGSSRWQTLLGILLPAASSGIAGGTLLALGRALGETMAVTLVIGNSFDLSPSILAPATTIASLLANQFPEASDLQLSSLMYAALILFMITLITNALAQWILSRSLE